MNLVHFWLPIIILLFICLFSFARWRIKYKSACIMCIYMHITHAKDELCWMFTLLKCNESLTWNLSKLTHLWSRGVPQILGGSPGHIMTALCTINYEQCPGMILICDTGLIATWHHICMSASPSYTWSGAPRGVPKKNDKNNRIMVFSEINVCMLRLPIFILNETDVDLYF